MMIAFVSPDCASHENLGVVARMEEHYRVEAGPHPAEVLRLVVAVARRRHLY